MPSPAHAHEPISAEPPSAGAPPARRTAGAVRRRRVPLLAAFVAALPAIVLTGCSSGAAKPAAAPASSAPPKPSAAPKVRYADLPAPCSSLSAKTVKSLVPGAKSTKGAVAAAGEAKDRGGCSWSGLNGYQYRYLDTAFQRYDNTPGGAAGGDQAASAYGTAVRTAGTAATAAKGKPVTSVVTGLGDEASLITWTVTKDHDLYFNATVVTRSANAIVSVDYIGAGLQGDHKPKASDVSGGAEKAAREALASLG